jgi:hypothetical protein
VISNPFAEIARSKIYGKMSRRVDSDKIENLGTSDFFATERLRFPLLPEPRECQKEAMILMAKICECPELGF